MIDVSSLRWGPLALIIVSEELHFFYLYFSRFPEYDDKWNGSDFVFCNTVFTFNKIGFIQSVYMFKSLFAI